MIKTEPLLSSAQAAERIGIDRSNFNKWVKAGRIPIALELPGKTGARLYRLTDVDRLAAERGLLASHDQDGDAA